MWVEDNILVQVSETNLNQQGSFDFPVNVTTLGVYAFSNNQALKRLDIPGHVKKVSGYAVANCYELTEVKLSSGTTTISGHAFYNAVYLRSLVLPDTLETIADSAFKDAGKMTDLTIHIDSEDTAVRARIINMLPTELQSKVLSLEAVKQIHLMQNQAVKRFVVSNAPTQLNSLLTLQGALPALETIALAMMNEPQSMAMQLREALATIPWPADNNMAIERYQHALQNTVNQFKAKLTNSHSTFFKTSTFGKSQSVKKLNAYGQLLSEHVQNLRQQALPGLKKQSAINWFKAQARLVEKLVNSLCGHFSLSLTEDEEQRLTVPTLQRIIGSSPNLQTLIEAESAANQAVAMQV